MPVPTLFHGTDARILRMSQAEIKTFKMDILSALDYLWKFYEPYTIEHTHQEYNPAIKGTVFVRDMEYLKEPLGYSEDSALCSRVAMAISINQHRLNSRKQWQYDGLYLTNWDWQAWGYAKRASSFGELGLVAQVLITGARKILFKGWNPDKATELAMDRIIDFSEGKAEPAFVVLDDLDVAHIKDVGGDDLKEGSMSRVFMYDGEINLSDYPIIDEAPSEESITDMFVFKNGALSIQTW